MRHSCAAVLSIAILTSYGFWHLLPPQDFFQLHLFTDLRFSLFCKVRRTKINTKKKKKPTTMFSLNFKCLSLIALLGISGLVQSQAFLGIAGSKGLSQDSQQSTPKLYSVPDLPKITERDHLSPGIV